ncbi:MAG: porphobilinogen synthase [Gammaproteobacteria bacterium]|nr:porphobilinogen synthase [Gammaproteobacteria bacterium]
MTFPQTRLRRLRQSRNIRRLISETTLSCDDLVYPLFVKAGLDQREAIASMPGQYQLPLTDLKKEAKEIVDLGIPAVLLFGIPEKKDAQGSDSFSDHGIMQQAIAEIKAATPELTIISDICLCEYTNHGHCGVFSTPAQPTQIDNDATLAILQQQVISHARAGSDIMAPSGMIDGMVSTIRQTLDQNQFNMIPILSYAVKYASCYYGPFRQAAEGAPEFGDRRHHQLNPANSNEGMREVTVDIAEGADMVMVKPALSYLDMIQRINSRYSDIPLAAYSVSGEYAMIKAAAAQGWLDETATMLESTLAMKRAGANFIITYFAKEIAKQLGQ